MGKGKKKNKKIELYRNRIKMRMQQKIFWDFGICKKNTKKG